MTAAWRSLPGKGYESVGFNAEHVDEQLDELESVFLQDRSRFSRFFHRNGMGNHADDLLQDMWIKLRRNQIGEIDDPISYLYCMAYNMILDHNRGGTRSGRREQEWNECNGPSVEGVSDEPSVERLLIAKDALNSAEAHLHRIGEPASRIFRLHRIEGKTQRAIATELRMGLSTVEKHLKRAYRAMIAFKDMRDEA